MTSPTAVDDWSSAIAPEVLASLSADETKRQRHIHELVQNQRNYVDELRQIHESYYVPLSDPKTSPIPDDRRDGLLATVFSNTDQLLAVNVELLDALERRVIEGQGLVNNVGDIMAAAAAKFDGIYPAYASNRELSKLELEGEAKRNPDFAEFLERVLSTSAKGSFDLNSLLQKPINRLVSYNLLLKDALKRTNSSNKDLADLPKAIELLTEVGRQMNSATHQAQKSRKLAELAQQIGPTPDGATKNLQSLCLLDPKREIIYEGELQYVKPTGAMRPVYVFLLDHTLVITIVEDPVISYKYIIYRRSSPIPLDLLRCSKVPFGSNPQSVTSESENKTLYLEHVASDLVCGGTFALVASTESGRDSWFKKITAQQAEVSKRHPIAESILCSDLQTLANERTRVIGSLTIGDRILIATPEYIYLSPTGAHSDATGLKPIVSIPSPGMIRGVDVIEKLQKLFVLIDKQLFAFNLSDIFQSRSLPLTPQHAKLASDEVSFFKIGTCADKTYVGTVHRSQVRSRIKLLDPAREQKRGIMGGVVEMFAEKTFYIPTEATSIDFLRNKLAVGCTRGFEIVDLKRVGVESNAPLMDPHDPNLLFATDRAGALGPIALFRTIDGNFLLCFDDCGFFVDRHGRLARPAWRVYWQFSVSHFAYLHPYILAFSDRCVEVYSVDAPELVQAIRPSSIIRVTHTPGGIVHLVKSENGREVISRLHHKTVESL